MGGDREHHGRLGRERCDERGEGAAHRGLKRGAAPTQPMSRTAT
jgi:hypothetical protein